MTARSLALALFTLLAPPVLAQDTTPAKPQEAPPGGALSLGQEVGIQVGEIYSRETHGDWQIRCVKAPEGQADPCQMYQRLADQSGQPTADINIFLPPADTGLGGGATLVAPLQTLLTEGILLSVDEGAPRRYQFSFCEQSGCFARIGFTQAEMQEFRAGSLARLRIVPALAPDQIKIVTMSLSGFTAGFKALSTPPAE